MLNADKKGGYLIVARCSGSDIDLLASPLIPPAGTFSPDRVIGIILAAFTVFLKHTGWQQDGLSQTENLRVVRSMS